MVAKKKQTYKKPRSVIRRLINKIKQNRRKTIIFGSIILVAIIALIIVISNIRPSQAEISRRLNEVIDSCMYNERSRGCSVIQEKYGMSFEYCHSLSDIPEIAKTIPAYGVARMNEFQTSKPPSGIMLDVEDNVFYPFYACHKLFDDVKNDITQRGLGSDVDMDVVRTLALTYLINYSTANITNDDLNYCWTYNRPAFNDFWKQIPNYSTILSEYDIAYESNKGCSNRASLQVAIDIINTKVKEYAHNDIVWQYILLYTEKYQTKHCSEGDQECYENNVSQTMHLVDFSKQMQKYIESDYFSSKIVIE